MGQLMRRTALSLRASLQCAVLLLGFNVAASAGGPPVKPALPRGYRAAEVDIPMRDGAVLRTSVLTPIDAVADLPIILERTPYDISDATSYTDRLDGAWRELAADGYIFVLQNIRGRGASGGSYVMYRGLRNLSDPKATDDTTDARDTIDWLVRHVPGNSGRVGIIGVSNPGSLAALALIDPHPALRAVSPQAPANFQFTGDDFFHNGAFSLGPNYAYAQWSTWVASEADMPNRDLVGFEYADQYEFFLRLGSLANVNERYFHHRYPLWDELVGHLTMDDYWRSREFGEIAHHTEIPTLLVGGLYDPQDQKGPFGTFDALHDSDTGGKVHLVVGPWLHGGWGRAADGGRALGELDFGSATGDVYRARIEAPFFARYLKDRDGAALPAITMFQTGTNRWIESPSDVGTPVRRTLYLRSGHRLSFEPPTAGESAFDEYVSDPANPVPHAPRPIPKYYTRDGQLWRVLDQRFSYMRPDTLYYETEPLDREVVIGGELKANLLASTTGTDTDWVVRLIDVYPEHAAAPSVPDHHQASQFGPQERMSGFHYLVSGEILRAKFRHGFATPAPVVPGLPESYQFSLMKRNHVFRPGHRILIEVQSSWFPLFDRNPGRFMDIARATEADYQPTTQRVFHSPTLASGIEFTLGGR